LYPTARQRGGRYQWHASRRLEGRPETSPEQRPTSRDSHLPQGAGDFSGIGTGSDALARHKGTGTTYPVRGTWCRSWPSSTSASAGEGLKVGVTPGIRNGFRLPFLLHHETHAQRCRAIRWLGGELTLIRHSHNDRPRYEGGGDCKTPRGGQAVIS